MATILPAKTPLVLALGAYNRRTNSVTPIFLLLNYDKRDKMLLFAKF